MREDSVAASDEPFRVYATNWLTLTLFWSIWNQWRKVVINNRIVRDGMDWTQAEAALTLSGIKRAAWPQIFEGLRATETAALEYLNGEVT